MRDATQVDRVKNIVVDSEMFFASATSFNDPFELSPTFSVEGTPAQQKAEARAQIRRNAPHLVGKALEEAVRSYQSFMSTPVNARKFERDMESKFAEFLRKQVGVCCLTGERDNLLVWAHYADSHAGICLEFDGACPIVGDAQAVIYSENRKPVNIAVDSPEQLAGKTLLTKSHHWGYEVEWRTIRWRGGSGSENFEPEHLTGIILGARASKETEKTVRGWLDSRPTPCTLYKARVSPTHFELLIEPV